MPADVKWGILGCAGIAEKFCVSASEAANSAILAVASRSKERAEAWIAKHCPGARAYGSYDELLDDDEIQAVYIPLPTAMKCEWVLKAAAKKKHVLCEKPMAGSMRDTRAMADACKAAGVQFMDNTMFMHHERLAAMRKVLDDAELFGKPKLVVSSFSIPCGNDEDWAKGNIRMKHETEPFGCLGDLGWYCIRFTSWAFGYSDPQDVSCHVLEKTDEGVPLRSVATMRYPEGLTATFDCSFKHQWRQWAEVSSGKCSLEVPDFVVANSLDECSFSVTSGSCGDRALTFPKELVKSEQLKCRPAHTCLVEKFSEIVLSGQLEEFWPRVALQTQLILGALVASAKHDGAWVTPSEADPIAGGEQ